MNALMRLLGNVKQNVLHPADIPKKAYNNTLGQIFGGIAPNYPATTHAPYQFSQLPQIKATLPLAGYAQPITPQNPRGSLPPPIVPPSFGYPPLPSNHPNVNLISGSYGSLQPYGRVPEDSLSPAQALQGPEVSQFPNSLRRLIRQ